MLSEEKLLIQRFLCRFPVLRYIGFIFVLLKHELFVLQKEERTSEGDYKQKN